MIGTWIFTQPYLSGGVRITLLFNENSNDSRCATCDKLPKECNWGEGPYAGTMLLYLQEIAVNK